MMLLSFVLISLYSQQIYISQTDEIMPVSCETSFIPFQITGSSDLKKKSGVPIHTYNLVSKLNVHKPTGHATCAQNSDQNDHNTKSMGVKIKREPVTRM